MLGILAGVTLVLGVLVALAPVVAEEPVVSWPRDGQSPTSTMLPLSPYRPLAFDATVPCASLRALDSRPLGGDALRTVPAPTDPSTRPSTGPATEGLTVAVADGRVTVSVSGTDVATDRLPDGDCRYRVMADAAGVRVDRDGQRIARQPGLLPPQVAELATEAGPAAAAGLAVELRPDDRYAGHPSALKLALLVAHGVALAATLLLAVRLWRGRDGQRALVVPQRSWADGVVVAVSAAWAVLGPVNWDDSWYTLMARNAGEAGYLGNYIYMFNATEAPFVAAQYVMQLWGTLGGWGLLWMRVLPLVYGLLVWVILRFALVSGDASHGSHRHSRAVPAALLVAHLLWWLPYGMMLRPEPLIAVFAAAVLLLAEIARRRRSLGALVLATSATALAVTVSPTGIVAGAPLVMTLPWLLALLRERGWGQRVTVVVVAAAAATIAVPVGFADASLGEVLDATATHSWYYLTLSWYEEIVHYNDLLIMGDTGVWGRRAPVLLTLAVLAVVAMGSGRQSGSGDALRRLLLSSAITMAVALVLLAVTPTKWVNHFGAVGPAGTVVLTAALLRSPLPRRAGSTVRTVAVVVLALATAVVFAGPNLWRPFSDWGQPFGNHLLPEGTRYELSLLAPHIFGVYLRNPVVWLVFAGLLAAGLAWWRRRGGRAPLTTDRGLLVAASVASVTLLLAVFVYAPIRQYPGWTVALSNVRALAGQHCGLAGAVQVLAPQGPQPTATGSPERSGDFALAAGRPAPLTAPSAGTTVWHDSVPPRAGDLADEQGTVTTPWFALPDSAATHLSVPVAAGTVRGQQVTVQFGTGDPADPRPTSTVEPALDRSAGRDTWQQVTVALDSQGSSGDSRATAFRIEARDEVTGDGSWLAIAAPSLTSWQPVRTLTRGQPVFADQLSAVLWPCVDQVPISDGIVTPPSVRLLTDDGIPRFVLRNPHDPLWGGTFVQVERVATYVRQASRIHPAGPPTRSWGQVRRVVYDHPFGLVEVSTDTSLEPGWERETPVTGEAYSGRKFLG
ncbi:MAG: arabinosyltransferase [Pseudonocardiaceae bacterium]|nr:arabinosyltransferase [Pseudonocardiaceae bacterium]